MAVSGTRPRQPRRGRRPTEEVREEVLQAAGELLFTEGMGGFTIDKVAALSGASKMTIYKWWPSKGALALDGYFRKVEPDLNFPDSGEIERDLRIQMRAFLGVIRDTAAGAIVGELIGQAQVDPELKAAFCNDIRARVAPLPSRRYAARRNVDSCVQTWTPRSWWISCGAPATTGYLCLTSR